MEHESFEDEAIAGYLNTHFIAIKVDREQRPDIDKIYMTAVQMIAASLAVIADEDMLDQALINLIRNAANALEDTQDAHITVNAYTDSKQRTVLEVQDNGPGVPEDLAENIFIPFFTTRTQGAGVGLALVRYIMLSHGGKAIYYRNELGGASFRLIFS